MNIKNISMTLVIGLMLTAMGCKKSKSQKAWVGNWELNNEETKKVVARDLLLANSPCPDNIVFSGTMNINEDRTGSITIIGAYCDSSHTLFSKTIQDFRVIDHQSSTNLGTGKIHTYQLYMNDDIYCNFESTIQGEKVTKNTKAIEFNIDELIKDGSTKETYNLKLVMTRK